MSEPDQLQPDLSPILERFRAGLSKVSCFNVRALQYDAQRKAQLVQLILCPSASHLRSLGIEITLRTNSDVRNLARVLQDNQTLRCLRLFALAADEIGNEAIDRLESAFSGNSVLPAKAKLTRRRF